MYKCISNQWTSQYRGWWFEIDPSQVLCEDYKLRLYHIMACLEWVQLVKIREVWAKILKDEVGCSRILWRDSMALLGGFEEHDNPH